jgi:energy-coupling factor transporter ATP-binding protein EcfA2
MRLERIVLKNVKAVTRLEETFGKRVIKRGPGQLEAPAIDLICAPNGQGKTTFLEAVSLVGHIPCARPVTIENGEAVACRAWAEHKWNITNQEDKPPFVLTQADTERLDLWLETLPSTLLGVYIEIEDKHDDLGTVKFCVVLDVRTHSLTSLLSANLTDAEFCTYAYIIAAKGSELKVEAFIKAIARGRTFNPHIEVDRDGPKRFVTYINTDMNDFGRGNDLRESPKTLNDEFKRQMVDRIGVPFVKSASMDEVLLLKDLEELKSILRFVLDTPRYKFSTKDVVSPSLEILDFHIVKGVLQIKVRLKERKGSTHKNDAIIENLSAGENESLFVFLMLLRLRNESSLILLDEPDLHVAGYMRPNLFKAVFQHFDPDKQHMLIVSHSISAVTALKRFRFGLEPQMGKATKQTTVRLRDHFRVLLKVHPEDAPHARFKLQFDRGFLRTLQSGLMTGSVTLGGRLGLVIEALANFRARFVSEMQKSNWAWYPFVSAGISLFGACVIWFLVNVIAPPENSGDQLHVDLVKFLTNVIFGSLFLFIPTSTYGVARTVKSIRED